MLTQNEVAELFNCHRDCVTMLREVGCLKATKIGKCYMFSQDEIHRFEKDYIGLGVSNKFKAIESFQIVQQKTR